MGPRAQWREKEYKVPTMVWIVFLSGSFFCAFGGQVVYRFGDFVLFASFVNLGSQKWPKDSHIGAKIEPESFLWAPCEKC